MLQRDCISFIEQKLFVDEKLLRTYKNGVVKIDGYLEGLFLFCKCIT